MDIDSVQNVNVKSEEAAPQEAQVVVSKENVAIPVQNVNGQPDEAALQETQVAVSKENVAIPMQNVNGKPEEAAPQEAQVAAGKENVAIPMQNANGKPQEAAPQEAQVVVSKENVAIFVQNVNGKSEEAALQEVKVAVSKENVAMPVQNVNGKSEQAAPQEVQVAVGKENVAIPMTSSSESEQKGVLQPCKGIKQTPLSDGNAEDVQVNIIGIGGINSGKGMEDASDDRTDTECSSSSSFGDTGSCIETDSSSGHSDAEGESPICDDWSEPLLIRKKKVTSHWRRFIRPLMWRCKWLELQLRKLHSQKLKYDKEIAAYDYKKQLEFSKYAVDGFDVKSIPISDGIHRNEVMKRKKRKRAEECDLSSYVANHTIFSYYENKDGTDGACVEDLRGVAITGGNPCNIEESTLNDMWYSVDHEDADKSLDAIFQKIEALELQVQKLKTRIDNVVSENPGKFCSVTQLSRSGPSNGFNNSGRNPASFAGNENTFPVSFAHVSSQLKSEFYEVDVLLPGNTSNCEGITPFIETTNRPRVEVLQENIKDDVLIQSQAAKEELHDFESTINQPVGITKGPEEQKSISLAELSEPYLVHNGHSALKVYSSTSKSNSSRNKRRRKSGSKRSGKRR